MPKKTPHFYFFFLFMTVLLSCAHETPKGTAARYTASDDCVVNGEYHAYFEQVEKCLEKEHGK